MEFPDSRFWIDWSARHFSALKQSGASERLIAVLPIGAVEQHGPHLPVSVDTTILNAVIQTALPHLPPELLALFLPTQALGKSNEHQRYAGTLTLGAETLIRIWMDIGASLARAGVRKLVILNSHGGQSAFMEMMARDLRVSYNLLAVSTSWSALPLDPEAAALFSPEERRFGIHAGDMETSMMLALQPGNVSLDHAQNFESAWVERAKTYPLLGNGANKVAWQMQDLNEWGAAGDATRATAEKGAKVLESSGRQLALLLSEVDRLPLSTLHDSTGWPT
jgi:creatinine amidohydrolase